jgi:hypothetical protein
VKVDFTFWLGFLGYVLVFVGLGGYLIGRLAKPGNFYEVTEGQRFISKGARARMDHSARWYNISKNVAAPLSTIVGGILTFISHLATVLNDVSQFPVKDGTALFAVGVLVPPLIAAVALVAARYAVKASGRHQH